MSTTPPETPEIALIEAYRSPYHSKSVVVTVGPSKVPFTLHEAKLAQTSFFEAHTPLSEEDRSKLYSVGSVSKEMESEDMKPEGDIAHPEQQLKADYHVEDRFFATPKAFDVFAKYLYNESPVKPSSHTGIKILMKAYGIAISYKCYGLQNKIISCLQQYYSSRRVKLDDLVWCANRFGDNTKCPLNAYMVEQIAFEIADEGYNTFSQANVFAKTFIEQGDRRIRGSLFEAIARYTTTKSMPDPANDKTRFLVPEIRGDARV